MSSRMMVLSVSINANGDAPMPHQYRNYAHLEGVVEQDPAITPTQDGELFAFPLSVPRKSPEPDGGYVIVADRYNVELETPGARLAMNGVKTGSRVMIDGSIRAHPSPSGMVTILAHRVVTTNNNGTLEALMAKDDPVRQQYRSVIHEVLDAADAEEFEWKHGYGPVQQYRSTRTGRNIFIDAETRQFCNRNGKPMTRDTALNQAPAPAS